MEFFGRFPALWVLCVMARILAYSNSGHHRPVFETVKRAHRVNGPKKSTSHLLLKNLLFWGSIALSCAIIAMVISAIL